jgi:hypothetical protein
VRVYDVVDGVREDFGLERLGHDAEPQRQHLLRLQPRAEVALGRVEERNVKVRRRRREQRAAARRLRSCTRGARAAEEVGSHLQVAQQGEGTDEVLVAHRAGRHPVAKACGVGGEVGGRVVELLEVIVVAHEAVVVRLRGAAVAIVHVQRPHDRGVGALPVWRAIGAAERGHEVVGAAIRRLVVHELLQPPAVHGTHAIVEDGLLRRER